MQGAAKVSSKRVNDRCGATTRKGPWMSEEDEVLLEYVQRHGPRDWSSIRSKGLLPRTGKSCRLRWVNKLQPNLKTDTLDFFAAASKVESRDSIDFLMLEFLDNCL
ncbi:uncharacterized protein A4U43_C03F6490 [Asparagus officinalis]|uniref:Uncharacterized protein n=1 Tax=Asparagus officinalis TaxID=4686 RepID=A0A5P1F7V5_ASPOF|nr:uncharacterized protein A4U43_C03F6490 [Asparagus officinalis]